MNSREEGLRVFRMHAEGGGNQYLRPVVTASSSRDLSKDRGRGALATEGKAKLFRPRRSSVLRCGEEGRQTLLPGRSSE